MKQRALWAMASVGLSLATFILLPSGCTQDYTDMVGTCEDDGNPCTVDKCASGASEHVAVANGIQCTLGENVGRCDSGSCKLDCVTNNTPCNCASDAECPSDKECIDWACTAGQCKSALRADGTLIDPLEIGDCKKRVCQGATPQTIADDLDTPADVPKDCYKPVCVGDMPGTIPDTTDTPDATGCTSYSCGADGSIMPTNALVGTMCMTGACNSMGACVDCLTAVEWTACGAACKIKKCDGETSVMASECKSNLAADGVCCDTACTDTCKSCNISNMKGTCSLLPYLGTDNLYTDPVFMTPTSCDATVGTACNGSGKCLKTIGKTCTVDSDCISSKCAPAKVCLGAKDELCTSNSQCASAICTMMGFCG